jgi:hydroxymethylpyrimidine/phosphomethylpyrimidine kinase
MSGSGADAPWPVALTIAGSDSGGGAGIQADLKTFRAYGVHGTSAITCLTAQNPDEVRLVEAVSPDMVRTQIETVAAGFPVAATKTGMLFSAPIIRVVAETVAGCAIPNLVVDPVMVATSGARLLQEDAVDALMRELLPRAVVVTPNLPEAEALLGEAISTPGQLRDAARRLATRYETWCVVKGGHLAGDEVLDVLSDGSAAEEWRSPRIDAIETHGTGCTFSAATAAGLALGLTVIDAVARAKEFVARALATARPAGRHYPLEV